MSEVSCTHKPLHVAAYVVYNLGACVILGLARLIISTFGYIYYSCCSSGAKLANQAKVKADNGHTLDKIQATLGSLVRGAGDNVNSRLDGVPTEKAAREIFRKHALRGFMEMTLIGASWYTYCDSLDPKVGLFGLGHLENGFNRLERDIEQAIEN